MWDKGVTGKAKFLQCFCANQDSEKLNAGCQSDIFVPLVWGTCSRFPVRTRAPSPLHHCFCYLCHQLDWWLWLKSKRGVRGRDTCFLPSGQQLSNCPWHRQETLLSTHSRKHTPSSSTALKLPWPCFVSLLPWYRLWVSVCAPLPFLEGGESFWKDLQHSGTTMQWWKSTVFQMWSECQVEDGNCFSHLLAILLVTQPRVLLDFIAGLGLPGCSPGPQALLCRAAPHPSTLQCVSLSQIPFVLVEFHEVLVIPFLQPESL